MEYQSHKAKQTDMSGPPKVAAVGSNLLAMLTLVTKIRKGL